MTKSSDSPASSAPFDLPPETEAHSSRRAASAAHQASGTDRPELSLGAVFDALPTPGYAVDQASLSRMFSFTRAEASLAAVLMAGKTLEQAADQLCVSIHTTRTHLKRMLLKTDTGRQAELLRMLLTFAGRIRLD